MIGIVAESMMGIRCATVSSESELAKLYGITTVDDPSKFNAQYPYTLTLVGRELGYHTWHQANQLLDQVQRDKGINIKESDNKYHLSVRVGTTSSTHKYSQCAVDLLALVRDDKPYEVDIR